MGKKRACRRSGEENVMHDKAVKLRKMTDEQLCEAVDNLYSLGVKEGYEKGLADRKQEERKGSEVEAFLKDLQEAKVAGIGAVTLNKLLKVARENGYI